MGLCDRPVVRARGSSPIAREQARRYDQTVAGRIERIFVKRAHRGPMDERSAARLVAGRGLEGSADQGGRRQVSLLSREAWEGALSELGAALDPAARRANLLVYGVPLACSRGRVLGVGACRLRVLGELTPCERMEEALPGLESALRLAGRGGVFAEVIAGGDIQVGDPVALEAEGDPGASSGAADRARDAT